MSEPLFYTLDGIPVYDEDKIWVVRRPVTYGEPVELHVFNTAWHLYKDRGYYFFSTKEIASKFMDQVKKSIAPIAAEPAKTATIAFAPYPIPVVTPLGEGYVVYITANGQWENDEVCVAMCDGGQWRHFNTADIRSHHNATYGITKPAGQP